MVSRLSRVPKLATPSGAASLYWLWHGALAVFVIGGDGRASTLPTSVAVSLNASPVTLPDPRLLSFVDGLAGERRLIVEITEHAAIEDDAHLDEALVQLRQRGLQIAIDDAGAGFASLRHVLRLSPDLIKVDVSLTRDVHRDPVRRALAANSRSSPAAPGRR